MLPGGHLTDGTLAHLCEVHSILPEALSAERLVWQLILRSEWSAPCQLAL